MLVRPHRPLFRPSFDAAGRCHTRARLHAPVAPLDPRIAMAAAVDRGADATTEPRNADEALTPAQALSASTDGQTTVAVGSRGDVVLLDDNPIASGTSTEMGACLRALGVAATIVRGRPVHLAL